MFLPTTQDRPPVPRVILARRDVSVSVTRPEMLHRYRTSYTALLC